MESPPVKRVQVSDSVAAEWWRRLHAAELRIRNDHAPRWEATLNDYLGRLNSEIFRVRNTREIKFNYLLSTANAILPAVASSDPYLRVRPRTESDKPGSRVSESAVNFVWRRIGATEDSRAAVLDCLLFGIGIISVEMPGETAPDVPDYGTGPVQDEPEEDPEFFEDEILLELGIEPPPQESGDGPMPMFRRVAPDSLLVPDGYTDLRSMPWVCHRRVVLLSDLRSDRRLRIPDTTSANTHMMGGAILTEETRPVDMESDAVTLYEVRYWTRRRDGMRQRRLMYLLDAGGVGTDKGSIVYHVDDPVEMIGYPYAVLKFVQTPGEFYSTTTADLASIQPIAQAQNDLMAAVLRHFRLASKQKYLAAAGVLSGSNKVAALLAADADLAVEEIARDGDVRGLLQLLPIAQLSNDVPFMIQTLSRAMYEQSGVDVYQRGGQGRKGTTATEVAVASKAFDGRSALRLRAYEQFVAELGRKILELGRQFWTSDFTVRTAGLDGGEEFIPINGDMIPAVFDLDVDAGSTTPISPQVEQQALLGLLQTVGATVEVMQPLELAGSIAPGSVARWVDRALAIFNEDRRLLVGPLAALAQSGAPSMATQPPSPEAPSAAATDAPEMAMQTNPDLAGGGPRPRPGDTALGGLLGQV